MNTLAAESESTTPVSVSLGELIRLKPVGELIRLATPRIRSFAAGGNLSTFKGRGVEFDESRPYQEGDDLRTIDWRVTARTGRPHTKVFREERNRPVLVWLDLRSTMLFATQSAYKAVVAARMAALVAWSAVANGDQIGGLVFNEERHEEVRPRLGSRAALRMLRVIATDNAWSERVDLPDNGAATLALKRLTRVARPGSQTFLFSDFVGIDPEFERQLNQLASHADVQLVHIYDRIEKELPPPGRYRIDVGKRVHSIDTSDRALRERYRQRFEQRMARLEQLARRPGVGLLTMETDADPAAVLLEAFARR